MAFPNLLCCFLLISSFMMQTVLGLNLQNTPLRSSASKKKFLILSSRVAILSTAFTVGHSSPVHATDLDNGSALFTSSCSGCHAGGSNLFSGNKTLFLKDLTRNKYDTSEAMEALIAKGKGQMPAYGSFISPKGNVMPAKYTAAEIKDITGYVLDQASSGWVVTK